MIRNVNLMQCPQVNSQAAKRVNAPQTGSLCTLAQVVHYSLRDSGEALAGRSACLTNTLACGRIYRIDMSRNEIAVLKATGLGGTACPVPEQGCGSSFWVC